MNRAFWGIVIIGLFLLSSELLGAPLSGSATYHGAYYGSSGNEGSIFQQTGRQAYFELSLSYLDDSNLDESTRFDFQGLLNSSDYRSSEQGASLERFVFERTKGVGKLPYRVTFGDTYADFSYRTLQQTTIGLTLELQPQNINRPESLLLLIGKRGTNWHDVGSSGSHTLGLSYVSELSKKFRMAVNAVSETIEDVTSLDDLKQDICSFAFEGTLPAFGRGPKHSLEGEIGHFSGDHAHNGLTSRNLSDNGLFMQLSASNRRLAYRFRFEDYGENYRPAGANIDGDRKSIEGHFTFRGKASSHTFRWQDYREDQEQIYFRDTKVLGLSSNLRGKHGWKANIRTHVQEEKDAIGALDNETKYYFGLLSKQLNIRTNLRLTAEKSETESQLAATSSSKLNNRGIAIERQFRMNEIKGSFAFGFDNYEKQSVISEEQQWQPTFRMSFRGKKQELDISFSRMNKNFDVPLFPMIAQDYQKREGGLRYRRYIGDKTFGLDYLLFRREETLGTSSRDFQIACFVTTKFGQRRAKASPQEPKSDQILLLTAMLQAETVDGAKRSLAKERINSPRQTNSMLVYDVMWFIDVIAQQRLVLQCRDDEIVKAGIVIDGQNSMNEDYEKVRRELVKRYGPPTRVWRKEQMPTNSLLSSRLSTEVYDWQFARESIRFGSTEMLDGTKRIEVVCSRKLGNPEYISWWFEELR